MRSACPLLLLSTVLCARSALALPETGTVLPPVQMRTVDGLGQELPKQRPTLILYESRASRPQNYPFKTRLKVLAEQAPTFRDRLLVVPIANLEAYDFWPIRGLAASTVRSEGKRLGADIYCDWNGSIAKVLGTHPEMSSVILVDQSGKVLFSSEGPLSAADQERVLTLLRTALGG